MHFAAFEIGWGPPATTLLSICVSEFPVQREDLYGVASLKFLLPKTLRSMTHASHLQPFQTLDLTYSTNIETLFLFFFTIHLMAIGLLLHSKLEDNTVQFTSFFF
ncbi:Hypothetical predicted protein [Podarcis lilfordi]|uniref:Uncharacterized protein n=1 Tax=Podarcis lilfordi TaxID=74358 RepID=A0AA35K138_9SAUR|nr:Hypothetical predicted protein [Podarcis lilfordi]